MKKFLTLLFAIVATLFTNNKAIAQSSGCIGTASLTVTIEDCVGIEETWNNAHIQLYPNPVHDVIQVVLPPTLIASPCEITISDVSGRTFYNRTVQEANLSIPMVLLPNGMYIISVRAEKEKYQRKIIKY